MSRKVILIRRADTGEWDAAWDDGSGACHATLPHDEPAAIAAWNAQHNSHYDIARTCDGAHTERNDTYQPCPRTDHPCAIRRH